MRFIRLITALILPLTLVVSCSSATQAPEEPYHHLSNGRYRNPPGSRVRNTSYFTFAKFFAGRFAANFQHVNVPKSHFIPEQQALRQLHAQRDQDSITWLGHKTFIIHVDNQNILTDPFLSSTAGPLFFGPRRYVPPGISIGNLPKINTILISHNHFDSLDTKTLKQLKNKQKIEAIVPIGVKKYFTSNGFANVKELDWYQNFNHNGIRYTAIPAVHWSRRSVFDYNKSLWSGFIIHTKKHNILFMCDSGYHSSLFKKIGKQYGPFDIALVDIGAYLPAEIMKCAHSTPEEAVKIAVDLRAKKIIAMHWGTVLLSDEPPFEPPVRFRKAATKAGYTKKNAWIMRIGETRKI